MSQLPSAPLRKSIYYWKCDRPNAFHGTLNPHQHEDYRADLEAILEKQFQQKVSVRPGPGQGNHITFLADLPDLPLFIRLDDSPENDDYLETESFIQTQVNQTGVPTPEILCVDASRKQYPFAWQIMRRLNFPDLNQHFKNDKLKLHSIATQIGEAIAHWQGIQPEGFGPFQPSDSQLKAFHPQYSDYFHLHLDRHLDFLVEQDFLKSSEASEILQIISKNEELLNLPQGCLVHKDLAFWNILGTPEQVHAYIDWDDAISGDPMDDFSLLACFHDHEILTLAIHAYEKTRPLPSEYRRRFWLHLLRNMIVKSVIRVGAGYFQRQSSFFLAHQNVDLREFTHKRLFQSLEGLKHDHPLTFLS